MQLLQKHVQISATKILIKIRIMGIKSVQKHLVSGSAPVANLPAIISAMGSSKKAIQTISERAQALKLNRITNLA